MITLFWVFFIRHLYSVQLAKQRIDHTVIALGYIVSVIADITVVRIFL